MSKMLARTTWVVVLLAAVGAAQCAQNSRKPRPKPHPAARADVVVAVADVACTDPDLARIVTDMLETALQGTHGVSVVGATRVRKAMDAPDAESLSDPDTVASVCKRLPAAYLVTSNCFQRQERIILTARLIDGVTGTAMSGGAAAAEGSSGDLLPVVTRVADGLAKRLASAPVRPVPPRATSAAPRGSVAPVAEKPAAEVPDELTRLRAAGLAPKEARPNVPLTEKELSAVIAKLGKEVGRPEEAAVSVQKTPTPVSRVRVLAALVRLALSSDNVESRRGALLDGPPDEKQIPPWARPSVVAALDEGWWDSDRPLKPLEPATWAFLAALVERIPLVELPAEGAGREECTGLIVDAAGLTVQRSSSPRILDENGRVVYPDQSHLPNMDYVQQHGLAAYCVDGARAPRAGARPIRVAATRVSGAGRDDVVISVEDADRVLASNTASRFLWRWNVVILVKGKDAPKDPVTPPDSGDQGTTPP